MQETDICLYKAWWTSAIAFLLYFLAALWKHFVIRIIMEWEICSLQSELGGWSLFLPFCPFLLHFGSAFRRHRVHVLGKHLLELPQVLCASLLNIWIILQYLGMEFLPLFPGNDTAQRKFLLKFEDDFVFEWFVISEPRAYGLCNTKWWIIQIEGVKWGVPEPSSPIKFWPPCPWQWSRAQIVAN